MPQNSPYNSQRNYGQQQEQPIQIAKVIEGNDPQLLVEEAKKLAESLSSDTTEATTTQVRRLFSTFRHIEFSWPQHLGTDATKAREAEEAYFELVLMKPKLEYVASKHKHLKRLTKTIGDGINAVGKDRARLARLMQFFEATVAYYTAGAAEKSIGQWRDR